jgi:2-polyprenyl-6-methoxyphenol hydroxylase-like FAD-dependent oxidoreductase
VLGNVNYGKILILINRDGYYQAGLIIAKGSFDAVKSLGLDRFREDIARIAPFLSERVNELQDWEQIKILTVKINRLRRWYKPGLLCIGDAAHAMSPAGGVGINLAIQDAVATANILAEPLLRYDAPLSSLAAVQRRREFPTRVTQTMQLLVHRGFAGVFAHPGPIQAPWQIEVLTRIPGVHRALGHAVGMGARPEHVRKEAEQQPRTSSAPRAAFAAAGIAAAGLALAWFTRRRSCRS